MPVPNYAAGERILLSMAKRYRIAVEIADGCYFVTEPLVAIHRCETLHAALNRLGSVQMERLV
jgi:hypothetical protein